MLAQGTWDYDDFAWLLGVLAGIHKSKPAANR
jgi:hypothetical protein